MRLKERDRRIKGRSRGCYFQIGSLLTSSKNPTANLKIAKQNTVNALKSTLYVASAPLGHGNRSVRADFACQRPRTTFAGELHRSDSTQQKPAPAPYCWGLSNKPANNGKLGNPQRLLRHIVSNRSKNSQESENSRRSSNKRYSSNSTTLRVSIASGELVRSTLYRQLVPKSNLL